MLYISLGGILLVVVLTCVLIGLKMRSLQKQRERQLLGIQWLKALRLFLSRVQKHRGLSTGYLNGDATLLAEIERLQSAIAKDIEHIEALGVWMPLNERWQGIRTHWRSLSQKFKQNDSGNNLTQHHWMIQNTLYLIEDMADEHALISLAQENKEGLEFLWRDLLQTIEYMGQARAIGTGVAAAGRCGSVERIRLNYLHKKIASNCDDIVDRLPDKVGARAQVNQLLHYIDERILAARCDVEPSEYFKTATGALECLYAQYDVTINKLRV